MNTLNETVSLKEYIDERFRSLNVAVQETKDTINERFKAVNEMRGMVTDAFSTYVTRAEYGSNLNALSEKMEAQQKLIYIGLGLVVALQFFVGLTVSVLLIFWRVK
jgi:hypothetical protein